MMKKIIYWLFALLITASLFPVINVHAEEPTRDIQVYLYREYTDCVFFISWENAEQSAAIRITTPDDNEIDATSQNTMFGNGQATVNAGNAKSGYWTVSVRGENLGSISVSGGEKNTAAAQHNAIQNFTAEASGGYINFEWSAVVESDTVNASITAVQGNNRTHTIWNNNSASKSGTASVSVDELQTGLYTFTIQIHDGRGQHTLTTDMPIYIKQSNAHAKLENIRVGSIDGEMFAAWNAIPNTSYAITLYDYETLAVIRTENINNNYYPVSLSEEIGKIKMSVAAISNNIHGEFDVFEIIHSTPSGTIIFPDYSVTRESSVKIQVDCPSGVTAGVYLNGTLLLENADAGFYDLSLSEGSHDVVAYIKDANGNVITFVKSITVDKTPPAVNLNVDDNIVTVSRNLIIGGDTEPNAVIAINGVEQELSSGGFMAKIALANGVNPITISAYDTAGNKSVETVIAERINQFDWGWTMFILPGIMFISLTVWYVYLNKKTKGAQSE